MNRLYKKHYLVFDKESLTSQEPIIRKSGIWYAENNFTFLEKGRSSSLIEAVHIVQAIVTRGLQNK
jgi:hypothetical protein